MIPLFAVGEPALLQSMDAPSTMWNAEVTVMSVKWANHPTDIHGMPQPSSFVYEIDIHTGLFLEQTLKKKDTPQIEILEKASVEVLS